MRPAGGVQFLERMAAVVGVLLGGYGRQQVASTVINEISLGLCNVAHGLAVVAFFQFNADTLAAKVNRAVDLAANAHEGRKNRFTGVGV